MVAITVATVDVGVASVVDAVVVSVVAVEDVVVPCEVADVLRVVGVCSLAPHATIITHRAIDSKTGKARLIIRSSFIITLKQTPRLLFTIVLYLINRQDVNVVGARSYIQVPQSEKPRPLGGCGFSYTIFRKYSVMVSGDSRRPPSVHQCSVSTNTDTMCRTQNSCGRSAGRRPSNKGSRSSTSRESPARK